MLLNQPQSKLGQLAHESWLKTNSQANNWHAKDERNFAHSLPFYVPWKQLERATCSELSEGDINSNYQLLVVVLISD